MQEQTQEKKVKPNYRSTIKTSDTLYEMVFDREQNKIFYFSYNNAGKLETYLEEVEIGGKKYTPLSPDNDLLSRNVVLFPSITYPYTDDVELLVKIKNFIHKYLDISDTFEEIATYYVMFTWIYDKFNEVPYLRAIGDFGSGKSRLLQAVGVLCYKPIFTAGATTASPIGLLLFNKMLDCSNV